MNEPVLARWADAERILDEVLDGAAPDRLAQARALCGADTELASVVERLLAAEDSGLEPANVAALVDNALREDTPAVELPTTIGPFRVLGELGRGGMGRVLLAIREGPGASPRVAVKLLDPYVTASDARRRFERERETLARLEHPNIARLHDGGVTADGVPFLVMEYVEGVPIDRYCGQFTLSIEARLMLVRQVCLAVEFAHSRLVVHRDLKPANVLVDVHGQVKLLDFGIAKWLDDLEADAHMTQPADRVLTPSHAAPEQFTGDHITAATDVYQLGLLMYELMTGRRPHATEGRTPDDVRRAVCDTETARPSDAPTPRTLARRLAGDLDAIVLKALRKDPRERYPTVEALRRDIDDHLAHRPVAARRGTTAYALRKYVRRHRTGLAAAAVILIASTAGVVVSSWMAVRASRAERVAQAVNDFLQNDVLAQASANQQAGPSTKPDPDLKVRAALDRAAGRIEGKFSAQPQVEAAIRQTIGNTYKDLGLYPEAQGQVERAIELRRHALGEEHPDTLGSMSSLTEILYMRGKYAQLETLSAKLLAVRRRVLGDQHSDTALTLNNLGVAYMMQGKYSQADALHTKALEVQRRVLGEDHKETLHTMSNLASLYLRQGNNAQAETFFSKVLEARRRVQGEEHPDTLIGMNNLGLAYSRQGKYAQAEPLYTKVLEIQRRVLGEEHSATLISMNNVAQLYRSQGKYAEEETLRSKVLEAQRRTLGEDHPITLSIMTSLATLYTIQGKYAQAEALFTKALAVGRRVQGEENPTTLFTKYRLADLYRNQGKYGPAEALLAKVVESRRHVLGEEHPDTLNTLLTLGHVRLLQQNYIGAGITLRDALKVYEKARPDTWQRYDCQSLLGASLAGQRKYDEAEPLLLSGYEGMIQRESTMPASDREMLKEAGNSIVKLYQSWGKPEKAAEWRQRLQRAKPASRPK